MDSLIQVIRQEVDYSSKLKLLQQIEQIIIKDAPVIPLFYTSNVYLVHNHVYDVELGPLGIANLAIEKIWKKNKRIHLSRTIKKLHLESLKLRTKLFLYMTGILAVLTILMIIIVEFHLSHLITAQT